MENTALAFMQHTSGCLKNGSPLMWWLHGFSLKLSFRKKNALFRCVLNLFYPYFLLLLAYMINVTFCFCFVLPRYQHKIITMRCELFFNLTFFRFTTSWLFLFKPLERNESGNSSGCSCSRWGLRLCVCIVLFSCTMYMFMCMCVYFPSLERGSYGTRPSINPANVHE